MGTKNGTVASEHVLPHALNADPPFPSLHPLRVLKRGKLQEAGGGSV